MSDGGKKFDGEKIRMDLLSPKALTEIARVMGEGAKKYGAQNWRKGIAWSRVYAAIQRHLNAWNDGETYDQETGISHLAHAGCGIMFLLEYASTHGELDDRYHSTPQIVAQNGTATPPLYSTVGGTEMFKEGITNGIKAEKPLQKGELESLLSAVQSDGQMGKAQRNSVPGLWTDSSKLVKT